MSEFILMFACLSTFTSGPKYKDGAYKATLVVSCDNKAYKSAFSATIQNEGAIRSSNIAVVDTGSRLLATSTVEVERPWIAPIPIFMSVAENKHKDMVVQKLVNLYNGIKE
jgi:hypothetical protein